jgi:hypothetical protein
VFFNEQQHGGRPHFHATYGGEDVSIDIQMLSVLAGSFPEQGLRLLREWANLHTMSSTRTGNALDGASG